MIAEYRVPRCEESPAGKLLNRGPQQPGVPGRVDVGPVIERVGVRRELHAVVPVWPAPRLHSAAPEYGERVRQLVVLVIVDQVAALDHELRAKRADGCDGPREHLCRQCLLRAERRLERRAEAIEEAHARRRGGVEHVGVGHVGEGRQDRAPRCAPPELGAVDQRLPRSDAELPISDRVLPGGLER